MNEKEPLFEYLEAIAEYIPAPFSWSDVEGYIMGLNTLALQGIGTADKANIVGKTLYEIYKDIHIADKLQYELNMAIQTGKTLQSEDMTADVITGKLKYYSATRAPLRNKKNEIIGVVSTAIEITEKKEAERLKLENIKLESQNKLNQVFLEKLAAEAEAEHLRLENEAYLAQKKEQAKFLAFIDKIQRDIQNYKIEALTEQIGIKPNISSSDKQIRLTKRELDVLYYLSLNKSPKDIAQIITIIEEKPVSDSTINAIINKKLYPKFEVFNIGQLVEKAIMLNQIPFLLDNSND
ncbi:MAG TPA: PAS domain-containing protein [Aquella sp.]|nr:PAS domain-containing protein [Aquella sp.]